ncbi:MAG TPA: hypothetical protein PL158_14120, partial [Bacillota bacterium]|nr:hypothetical protein [Bacillota bacterium]HOL11222.1 hypothetical protein [Bacillota bacterium]
MAATNFFLAGESVKKFNIKVDSPGLIMGNLNWFDNTPISMAIFAPGQMEPLFEKNGIKSLDFSQVVTKESLLLG